jgi:hypothetical protein
MPEQMQIVRVLELTRMTYLANSRSAFMNESLSVLWCAKRRSPIWKAKRSLRKIATEASRKTVSEGTNVVTRQFNIACELDKAHFRLGERCPLFAADDQ